MAVVDNVSRPQFDWARFRVRFVCGVIPGSLLSFGFWVQMCRPTRSLGLGEWLPRQLAERLGLEAMIDSSIAGLVVVLVFTITSGIVVGLWRSKTWCSNGL